MLPTPTQLVSQLDRFVIGQVRAKQVLASAAYAHFLLAAARRKCGVSVSGGIRGAKESVRQHVLLLGPTGSGKSLLVRTLAELLGLPFVRADVTRMSEAGYVGEDVTNLLFRLVDAAKSQIGETGGGKPSAEALALAETGIVFLDEIDKVASSGEGLDVSRQGVQQGLLSMLDGGKHLAQSREHGDLSLDTSHVWFVCAGAFPGIDELIRKRLGASCGLGFDSDEDAPLPGLRDVVPEDLSEYGFLPEFIGRFGSIATLDELGYRELYEILNRAENGSLQRERELFALHGIQLGIADEVYEGLIRRALQSHTGARGLDRSLHEMFASLRFDLPDLAAQGVWRIDISDPARSGQPEYVLEEGVGGSAPEFEELRRSYVGQKLKLVEQPKCSKAKGIFSCLEEIEKHFAIAELPPSEKGLYLALRRQFAGRSFDLVWLFEQLIGWDCGIGDLITALENSRIWDAKGLLAAARSTKTQRELELELRTRRESYEELFARRPKRRRFKRSRWIEGAKPVLSELSQLERCWVDALGDGELPVQDLLIRAFVELGGVRESFLARAEVGLKHLLNSGVLCAFDGRRPSAPDLDGRELFPLRRHFLWSKDEGRWKGDESVEFVELYRAGKGEERQMEIG